MPASDLPTGKAAPGVHYRVLGPLEVRAGERSLNLGGSRQRRVLAALLLGANRPVSLSHLTEAVWDGVAPATARRQVQNAVAALRAVLARVGAADAIATHGSGYLLRVSADALDASIFDHLVQRARAEVAAGDPLAGAATLRDALGLWRGPVLAGLGGQLPEVDGAKLEERRLAALEEVVDLELATGGHARLVSELRGLVAEHPLRERFAGQLMVALYRGGRQAEALAAFHELAQRLSADLGIDPGPPLRRLYEAVLREDPELSAPGGAEPAAEAVADEPIAQLPPDPPQFTGRRGDLDRLDRLLSDGHTDSAVVISAIAGTAGIGKTALAIHWSHRVRDKFADGQLYVNLHGYAGTPVRPLDALARFLRALGVPAGRIPTDADEAAAMYRSLLADRRVLVVLDNARSPEQVRPLLPGNKECVVLVTSRDQLGGLVALDGARRLTLDVLPVDESVDLLAELVGDGPVDADPAVAERLAADCGHLPLALRLAGALARRTAGDGPVRTLTGLVPDGGGIRGAFEASYARLAPPVQRVFRLLGLVPGPEVTPAAVAALAHLDVDVAGAAFDELTAAGLVQRADTGDRYAVHDQLHRYAAELAAADADAEPALRRYYDHYLGLVGAAASRLYPHNLRVPLPDEIGGTADFASPAQAAGWLDRERPTLVATVRYAAAHGPRAVAWRLADALRGYFWMRMDPVDWLAVAQAGQAAAEAEQDLQGQAAAHLSLALLHRRLSHYPLSIDHQNRALDLTRQAGWTEGEAAALANLGGLFAELGRLEEAADHHIRALDLNLDLGDVGGQAVGYSNLGRVYGELGRLELAVEHSIKAIDLYRRIGSRGGENNALRNLGVAYHALGRFDAAVEHLTRAIAIHRDIGDRADEAEHLCALGRVHSDAGRYDEATRLANTAQLIAREAGRRHEEAAALNLLAGVARGSGQHRSAVDQYEPALRLARESDGLWFEAEALIGLAGAHRALGRTDEAVAHAGQAIEISLRAGFRVPAGQARTELAAALLAAGTVDRAVDEAERALGDHVETGHRLGEVRTHLVLGRALAAGGRTAAARAHWQQAVDRSAGLGVPETAEARALLLV